MQTHGIAVDTWSDDEDTFVEKKVVSRRSTSKSAKSTLFLPLL